MRSVPDWSGLPPGGGLGRWGCCGYVRIWALLGIAVMLPSKAPADLVEAHLAVTFTSTYRRAVVQELLGMARGAPEVRREAQDLGKLPTLVITGGPKERADWHPV